MFLHVNTVRYRLRRFEELTGTSLRRVEDLVQIWWALRRARLPRQES
jgi:DNA-binding PucR family transcriptional regulator